MLNTEGNSYLVFCKVYKPKNIFIIMKQDCFTTYFPATSSVWKEKHVGMVMKRKAF